MSKQILVVDDDASIREVVSEILTEEGYSVTTATNGLDALDKLHARGPAPGLILLDLMMPVMDGLQFLDRLSADPSLPSVPVVVLSANIAAAGGMHRGDVLLYLRKPIDLERLVETVGRWYVEDEPS